MAAGKEFKGESYAENPPVQFGGRGVVSTTPTRESSLLCYWIGRASLVFAFMFAMAMTMGAKAEDLSDAEKASLRPWQLWGRPEPFDLPELFVAEGGRRVKTVDEWETVRRPEILKWFETSMHGVRPVGRPKDLKFECVSPDKTMMGGEAVRKQVRISYRGPFGVGSFDVLAFVPVAGRSSPVPVFMLICNDSLSANMDPDRKVRTNFLPAEEIVRRGYAVAVFNHADVAPDDRSPALTGGVYRAFGPLPRTTKSWGAISAWAWGASRVLDWIESEPMMDAKRVAVVGHSRCGKTALYAAATDVRFAMACVNDSGCCGAKLNHAQIAMSENIENDNVVNPHWFCLDYRRWDGLDHKVPYDQHQLAACIAPRLLAIASASEDLPSGPYGEYLTAKLCSPVWELYGKKGLVADPEVVPKLGHKGFPPYNTPINAGCVSYHLRKGIHLLDEFDWRCFMDFADRHGWNQ